MHRALCFALLVAAFASGAFAGAISTGDMLIPLVSSSSFSFGSIQERIPGSSFTLVQTIPLPTGYHYTSGQYTSVIVRSSDHHIFTNVLDTTSGGSVAAVLELDSTGAFVAVKDNALPTGGNINQLRFDPSDSTQATVLGGVAGPQHPRSRFIQSRCGYANNEILAHRGTFQRIGSGHFEQHLCKRRRDREGGKIQQRGRVHRGLHHRGQ